jgi:hypothetical protein
MVTVPEHNATYYYPTEPNPVPLADVGRMKCVYLADRRAHRDPTIVWGTAVDAQPMTDFITAESRNSNTLLSAAHVLVGAVARSLAEHPHFNRKVIGRRVYPFKQINIAIPLLAPADRHVIPVLLQNVERLSLQDIARNLWNEARNLGAAAAEERRRVASCSLSQRFWTRIWRELKMQIILRGSSLVFMLNNQFRRPSRPFNAQSNGVSALVNLLSFPGGAPPMLSFKPSSLQINSAMLTVTMGAAEWRPAVVDGQVVARRMTPLFVKADHRLVYTHEIAAFMNTLCRYLTEPGRLTAAGLQSAAVLGSATTDTTLRPAA